MYDAYKTTDYKQQQKIMPKPKATNRKKLVAFALPIIRKEKLPMSEELEKLNLLIERWRETQEAEEGKNPLTETRAQLYPT